MTKFADRIAEVGIAVLVCALIILYLTGSPGDPGRTGDLAAARPKEISIQDRAAFLQDLARVRHLVDGNGEPEEVLSGLISQYPGRHEVWALSARYREGAGDRYEAVMDYARAARLHPDYLDDRSPLYIGGRVERLVQRVFAELRGVRDAGKLADVDRKTLEAVYFIRRRLAGGCE